MNLEQILGDRYHEGMTIDEINTALSGMKLADLSTGAYVDKNKYDADLKAKDAEINKKAKELSKKMTDDEKKAAADLEKDNLIASLQEQIKNQVIGSNQSKAESLTSKIRTILDIKENDTEYNNFISNISSEDSDKTSKLASYINKLVEDSYSKGKQDATKNNLGNFSVGVGTQQGGKGEEIGEYGKRLAQATKPQIDANTFFKRD